MGWVGRAAIGRDGGQDTQGAWQGSYQVTSARPVGALPGTARPGRQINASAPAPFKTRGEVVTLGQARSDSTEIAIIDADMTREPRLKRTNRRVSEEGIRAARLPLGRPDTVLFAMYASLGAMAVLDVPATWNQAILGITPRPGTSVDFVRYALIDRRRDLLSLARSNTQANLNQEQVGNLRILVPALGIQRRIAQFLDRECARIMVAGTREADLAARLKPVPAQLFEADHQVRMAERVRLRFSLRAVEQGWSPNARRD
jgi:hypothetical protein